MNGQTILNDKDLRRQQITDGSASCYAGDKNRHNTFGAKQIVMQVGDNIEDYSGVLQEHADIDMLLNLEQVPFVLLPNPMYGSWR